MVGTQQTLIVVKYDKLFPSIQITFQTHAFKIDFHQEHSEEISHLRSPLENVSIYLYSLNFVKVLFVWTHN